MARLMREAGLVGRRRRRHPRRRSTNENARFAPNLLARKFRVDRPNRSWVVDFSCVPTRQGLLYVAVVLDLFSRRIVGWAMGRHAHTELVLEALDAAYKSRRPAPGLLHHSDRGAQYASDEYFAVLRARAIEPSMSRPGQCLDNAVVESFFRTLKTELVQHRRFATRDEARAAIFEYIECFYNQRRLHSTLGYLSPHCFEQENLG